MLARPCPCCVGSHTVPLHDNRMAPIDDLDLSYRVGQCRQCGFLFADQLPEPEVYARYYQELSKYDVLASVESVPSWDRARIAAALGLCSEFLRPDALIADIGCGSGYLLSQFVQEGFHNVYGLDPARSSAETARTLFGLTEVRTGLLQDAGEQLPLADIDLACMTGVIEHLHSPRQHLQQLIDDLRVGALILLELPGLEHFDAEHGEPFGEFSLEHIQYFSRASLSGFMRSLGTEPLVVDFLPTDQGPTEGLFGLFRVTHDKRMPIASEPGDAERIVHYINTSTTRLSAALSRIPDGDFLIFGAGSHTARLLPALAPAVRARVRGVFDSNANLHGKLIDGLEITPSAQLGEAPPLPVVVSSYRAQAAITAFIAERATNPVVLLY